VGIVVKHIHYLIEAPEIATRNEKKDAIVARHYANIALFLAKRKSGDH
jgi:hypothetical protein